MVQSLFPKKLEKFLETPISRFPGLWQDFQEELSDWSGNLRGMTVYEDNNHLVVEVEVPGFKQEDIDLKLNRGVLRISAERKTEETDKDRRYWSRTQATRSYCFALPSQIDEKQEPKATYKDGILKVCFQKVKESETRKIPINKGS